MQRYVFGSEDAKFDELLKDCYVAPAGAFVPKPILRGPWGSGKTAVLFHTNANLQNALSQIDKDIATLWYIDETRFDIPSLLDLHALCGDDTKRLQYTLEPIWEAEILRTTILLLDYLWPHYGSPDAEHWRWVRKAARVQDIVKPIWHILPEVLNLLRGHDAAGLSESITRKTSSLLGSAARTSINKCLRDIDGNDVQPAVAIDPIETPQSDIEKAGGGLAQAMIASLLNLFLTRYIYQKDLQPIRIQISIPWHRAELGALPQPQKYRANEGRMTWSETTLKRFIEKRIEYEFKLVGRSFTPKPHHGYWEELFGDTIENLYCHKIKISGRREENIKEKSFHYFLRHTHRRPRDLQRLAREAVEHQASYFAFKFEKDGTDAVLSGRPERLILKRLCRAAVTKCARASAMDRIDEAGRRFREVPAMVEAFLSMEYPCSVNDLKVRLEVKLGKKLMRAELLHALNVLWHAGIIGAELTYKSSSALTHLNEIFRKETLREYLTSDGKISKHFLFHYTCDDEMTQLLTIYDSDGSGGAKDVELAVIFHPTMNEQLKLRPTHLYPIGA